MEADDLDRATAWVEKGRFERIALQFPDELLPLAVKALSALSARLPERKVFLLGDSTYGSSSVDEVGAEHYGADCIVHVGPSDQQHAGNLPALFVFGRTDLRDSSVEALAGSLLRHLGPDVSTLVLVCDLTLQHLAGDLAAALGQRGGSVLVAEPHGEAATVSRGAGAARWRDWRFGTLPLAAWWAAEGPLLKAAAARPDPLCVCGRQVRRADGGPAPRALPERCGVIYVGPPGSGLELRLMLRYGNAHRVCRADPRGGEVAALSSDAMLLRRYRFVEVVKSAHVVGLLLCATGSSHGQALADRLEALLRQSGRRVYRFVIGKVLPEKLGNFPQVECYVSLASPEHFPFDVRDLPVPIASPYELEVALGAREWTGSYVTDPEELLLAGPVVHIMREEAPVHTLGARPKLHNFAGGAATGPASGTAVALSQATPGKAPALAEVGLHGVPARYVTEPR